MVGRTLSHYRLEEKLGEGGMGVVYRARDVTLDRDVAIKVLPEGTLAGGAARRRFRKEALALARLNHPNIESVYESGSEGGIDFLVTEYVPGQTLAARLGAGVLTEAEIRSIGAEMASALAEAHAQGVFHCDLKPANIILTPKGRVKLLDFGVATLTPRGGSKTTRTLTSPEDAGGTLPYIAPERLRGEPATERSDVYSAGAVLYELATGTRAFPAESSAELVAQILTGNPVSPRASNPGVSPELEAIILRCLDKDPGARYASAVELGEELVPPAGSGVLVRRRRRGWMAFGLSAGALAICAVLAYWFLGSRTALSFSPRDWILATDFENQTGEPIFDRSLSDAFTISLEQSKHANVFPRSRVEAALRRMQKVPPVKIDERLGRELCARENIRALVTCGISKAGRRYVLSARLLNPYTGDAVRSYLERAEDQDHVLDALGNIANRVRRDLGESLALIRRGQHPLAEVTTSSLQALKSYSDAEYMWSRGQYDAALRLYIVAVEQDPDFAMAHAGLGNAYCSHLYNDRPKCKQHYAEALKQSSRITVRERLFLQALAEANIGSGDDVKLWRAYLAEYPDDVEARFNLARYFMQNNREEEAIDEYKEIVRLAPTHASAYINLATSYSLLGRYPESLAAYNKAFELEPGWITNTNLNHEYGFALAESGDRARARQVFGLALDKPDLRSRGLRSTAMLDLYEGKWRSAKARLREAILISRASKQPLSEARDRFHLALVLRAEGDAAGATAELDRADRALREVPAPPVWMSARIACEYARAGRVVEAERILSRMKQSADSNQTADVHMVEGWTALARGDRMKGLAVLEAAARERGHSAVHLAAVALAYDRTGDAARAIESYETLVSMKGRCLGWEAQHVWVAAQYRLAELYAARKDAGKALEFIDRLRRPWSDPDPDLVLLHKTNALRSKLAGKTSTA